MDDELCDDEFLDAAKRFFHDIAGKGLLTETLERLFELVDKLVHEGKNNWDTPLELRSPTTLKSLSVIFQLLAGTIIDEWNAVEGKEEPRKANVFALPDVQVDVDESWIGLYSKCPEPVSEDVARRCIKRFLKLKSNKRIIRAWTHVNDEKVTRSVNDEIMQIDTHVDTIIMYLSASNWSEVYQYTKHRLAKLRDDPREGPSCYKGLEVIGLLFLDLEKLGIVLTDYLEWIPHVKRPKNVLFVEYMMQHSIVYWIQSHPWDVVTASHDTGHFREVIVALIERIYRDTEKKIVSTWAFITLLSSLVPDMAEKFLQNLNVKNDGLQPAPSTASGSSSSSRVLQPHLRNPLRRKKHSTEHVLDSLEQLRTSNERGLGVSTICYTLIGLVASSIYSLDPQSTIVGIAQYLYAPLLDSLYKSDMLPSFSRVDVLQSHFVITYSIINLNLIERDLIQGLSSPSISLRKKRNVVCGLSALRFSREGDKSLLRLFDDAYDVFINYLESLTIRLSQIEQAYSQIDPKECDWLVDSMTTTLRLVFTYPTRTFGDVPASFSNTIVFCCTSRNQKLRRATTQLLFDFVKNTIGGDSYEKDLEITRVSTRELLDNVMIRAANPDLASAPLAFPVRATVDSSHVIWAILDGVTKNIHQTAQTVLNVQDYHELERKLRNIRTFLKARLFISSSFECPKRAPAPQGKSLSRLLESALLLCLCSPRMEICRLALENMRYLIHEIILDCSQSGEFANISMFVELVSDSAFVTPMTVHKKLSRILQKVDQPGSSLIDVWKVVYDRWDLINSSMVNGDICQEQQQKEWRSFSGFLSSMLHPLLNPKEVGCEIPDNVHFKARIFVVKMVEFLVSNDSFVGKTTWKVLFDDTAPLVYHFVLDEISSFIEKCVSARHGLTTLVYTQAAGVIMAMVDRLHKEDIFLSGDFGNLSLKLMNYVSQIRTRTDRVKMAIQVCKLMESIAKSLDTLDVTHGGPSRSEVVATLSQWLERAVSSIVNSKQYSNAVRDVVMPDSQIAWLEEVDQRVDLWLIRDAAVAIARALKEIMKDMPIDWTPQSTDPVTDLSRRFDEFKRLFELYTNILNKITTFSPLFAETSNNLRTQVVSFISRFLQSNVDVGLKIAMEQGFSPDPVVRCSFLEIFNEIVQEDPNPESIDGKGYEEFVDFLNSDMTATLVMIDLCPSTDADHFAPAIMRVLQSQGNELSLVESAITEEIVNTSSSADLLRRNCVATKILTMYANEHGQHYLSKVITPFVAKVAKDPESFRFETNITRLSDRSVEELKANSARMEFALTSLVDGIVAGRVHLPPSFYSICRTIAETTSVRFPQAKYVAVGAFFFLRFFCPPLVSPETWTLTDIPLSKLTKSVLLEIAKTVKKICTGGYEGKEPLFGQLMVDASPIAARLRDFVRHMSETHIPSHNDSRELSAESLSSISETMSSSMESLEICRTQEHSKAETRLSPDIVAVGSAEGHKSETHLPDDHLIVDQGSLFYLHVFLFQHKEEINHRLLSDFRRQRLEQKFQRVKADFHNESLERNRRFANIIRSLGTPPDVNQLNFPSVGFGKPSRLMEFMSRNEHRDLSPVLKRKVIQEGRAPNGYPVLIVTLANYIREELDTELVIYRFFQLAFRLWNQRFYLFYDFTGCKPTNILSQRARAAAEAMMTEQWTRNLRRIYYFNVGTLLLSPVKNILAHHAKTLTMTKDYVFLSSRDITKYFDLIKLNLDPRTQMVIKDYSRALSYKLSRMTGQGLRQVNMQIGSEYIQLESQEKYDVAVGISTHLNDVYHLSKVSAVTCSGPVRQGEFNLEIVDGEVITLVAPGCQDLVRNIEARRSKLGAVTQQVEDKTLGLKDAGAFLLNVGLVNLCSTESAEVKAAAYNLVCNLAHRYDFSYASEVCAGVGLGLPYNAVAIAEEFSASVAQSRPELTFDFIMSFAQSYASLPSDQIERSVVYLTPWMQNVASLRLRPATKMHIAAWRKVESRINECASGFLPSLGEVEAPSSLVPEMSTGPTLSHVGLTTAHLVVRTLLALSTCKINLYSSFLVNVWPMLCVEESLTETLLDETVAYAMCSYELIDPVLAVQTTFPTLALCGTVLSRCRALLAKPLPPSERSLVSHPNWLELVILTRMLSSLSFESLTVAETYLTEIFQLVTAFLYTGPYSFRLSLFKLLTNVLHAFVCSPKLSRDQKRHLMQVWDQLEDVKGLVFGLSDDSRAMTYDYFVIASAQHVDTCCSILRDIMRYAGTIQQANAWRARWASLTMSACLTDNPPLQCRGFIVLGSLARVEIDDNILSRVLQVLEGVLARGGLTTGNSTESMGRGSVAMGSMSSTISGISSHFNEAEAGLVEEYGACIVSCLVQMTESLTEMSQYNGRLFWLAIALINTSSVVLFTQGLSLLQAHLHALDNLGVFRTQSMGQYLLKCRRPFDSQWMSTVGANRVRFSEDYFHAAVMAHLLKGLERDKTRDATLNAIGTLLELCVKNEQTQQDPPYMCYLYFLYLGSQSPKDLDSYLWIVGSAEDEAPTSDVPLIIEDFLHKPSTSTILTLALGATLFLNLSEESPAATRYLDCLAYIDSKEIEKACMVYSIVRPTLLKIVETSQQEPLLRSITKVGAYMLGHLDLLKRLPLFRHKLDNLLTQTGFDSLLGDVTDKPHQLGAAQCLHQLIQTIIIDPDA